MNVNRKNIKSVFLITSWALYDLANQFFALNVVSLYFVLWLTVKMKAPEILYSIAFAVSTFFVAFFSPLLGEISDLIQRRQPFLISLTLLSVVFTMLIGISKSIFLGLLFFGIANFGCQTAIVFYNALLMNIAPKSKLGLISGFGRMLGYSGAILALYFIKPVLKNGYQAVFLPSGIYFLIFSLPCMIFIKEKSSFKGRVNLASFFGKQKVAGIVRALRQTISNNYVSAELSNFFKASFFGLCGVNVIILFMSIYAKRVFHLDENQMINLLAFSTLFAIAGSMLSGIISDFIGHKRILIFVFILWILSFLLSALAQNTRLYWFIGALVGTILGSTWVVSRALGLKLAPEGKLGEVFGLFNLVGYLSAVAGSIFWGVILLFLSTLGEMGYRIAMLSLNLFMVLGFVFLLRIREDK